MQDNAWFSLPTHTHFDRQSEGGKEAEWVKGGGGGNPHPMAQMKREHENEGRQKNATKNADAMGDDPKLVMRKFFWWKHA